MSSLSGYCLRVLELHWHMFLSRQELYTFVLWAALAALHAVRQALCSATTYVCPCVTHMLAGMALC